MPWKKGLWGHQSQRREPHRPPLLQWIRGRVARFFWYNRPKRKNIPNGHNIHYINGYNICVPKGRKIDHMAIKYTNIFHSKTFQNLPKLGFMVWKYTIWQLWSGVNVIVTNFGHFYVHRQFFRQKHSKNLNIDPCSCGVYKLFKKAFSFGKATKLPKIFSAVRFCRAYTVTTGTVSVHLTTFHLTTFHLTTFHITTFHITTFHLTTFYLTTFHLTAPDTWQPSAGVRGWAKARCSPWLG
jgi:hypothetical protein